MKRLVVFALGLGISIGAHADIWKWLDAQGKTHFVDTNKTIFTWVDEFGKIHYSDKPDHEDAVSVQLVWHSTGKLQDLDSQGPEKTRQNNAYPGESVEERQEREMAEAYYCKRAKEIYDSYVNAPRLYKTDSDGERTYLSDEEAAQTLAETQAKVDDLCL